jgi:hypothetical protein
MWRGKQVFTYYIVRVRQDTVGEHVTMDAAFQTSLALQWRSILALDPERIFGSEASRLLNRTWGDRIPQPGYVGPDYRPGGLVFVSMNPGGGRTEEPSERDLRQYDALQRLRDCGEQDALASFMALARVLQEIMPTWKVYKVFVEPVLRYSCKEFSSVAYLNLLKWRTKESNGLRTLYKLSWEDHTKAQIGLLQPSMVIAIGTDAGKAFRRFYTNDIRFQAIPRVIGNNIGQPGRDALARIKKWFEGNGL